MKKLLYLFGIAMLALVLVVLIRTFLFKPVEFTQSMQAVDVQSDGTRLSQAITYQTISHKKEMRDDSTFNAFHSFLEQSFPNLHAKLKKEVVNDHSLLYTWQGSAKDKKPLVLAAHMDVVPVDFSSANKWDQPPFAGNISEEFIYGRGTIDDKGSLLAILEAIEHLLNQGLKPSRTIILAFGHDEEIGGDEGAGKMAQLLEQRGVEAWMVIDEGGTLATGIVPGIEGTVALIGTSEKGYVSLDLQAEMAGGHSSMPENTNALESIIRAITKLKNNPLPDRFSEPLNGFVTHVGPHLPFVQKMAFANLWLFKPLVFSIYNKSASGAALIHTTQVVTMMNSGVKDNVVPTRAKAVINYRLLPGDTPKDILERARNIIDDSIVNVAMHDGFGVSASPVSSHASEEFGFIASAIRAVNQDVIVSPYLVLGATDGRYYYNITDKVYRFSPIPLIKADLERIHGINERVTIEGYRKSVSFYATLISNS